MDDEKTAFAELDAAERVAPRIRPTLEAFLTRAELAEARLANSLDAVWAEAESDGTEVVALIRRKRRPEPFRWELQAIRKTRRFQVFGPTPVAALRALTERLRAHAATANPARS